MKLKYWALCLSCCFYGNLSYTQIYTAGETYFSDQQYIEFQTGNFPLIISAPHGGILKPEEIPDRDCSGCVYTRDTRTQELARFLAEAIQEEIGCFPHLVINRLHRSKLDANRDLMEASDSNEETAPYWEAYHDWIKLARDSVTKYFGKGLFLDIHGHGHNIQRVEIGYLLSGSTLRRNDFDLDNGAFADQSSIRSLAGGLEQNLSFSELIRGDDSFGTLLEDRSYPSVPSVIDLSPSSGDSYFSGGFNTRTYGSIEEGKIDAIQLEFNFQGVRDSDSNVKKVAEELAEVVLVYLKKHYFSDLSSNSCMLSTNTTSSFNEPKVNIYPNPNQGVWMLRFPKTFPASGQGSIRLVSMQGQVVLSQTFQQPIKEWQVQRADLSPGIYVLQMLEGTEVYTRKVVIGK